MKKTLLLEIITVLLVMLLLYASFSKYADFEYFKQSMHNQPLPNWVAVFFIWTIPPIEILIAFAIIVGLFIERLRLWGFYAFFTLMALFTIYISLILLHVFPRVPCSCGELIQSLTWGQHLLFNLFFIFLAFIAIRIHNNFYIGHYPDKDWKLKNISRAKPGDANT